jgi:hypothetical protein
MTDPERYVAAYLAPLPAGPRTRSLAAAPPPLDTRHWYLAADTTADEQISLPQLFIAGVECGHVEARDELRRRVSVVDAKLDEFRAIRDRSQLDREAIAAQLLAALKGQISSQLDVGRVMTHLGKVEEELMAARARTKELETSTVWRASAPLRRSVHRIKIALARLRASWVSVRHLPRYAEMAASILRNEGAGALTRRVARRLARSRRFVPAPGQGFVQAPEIAPLAFTPCPNPRVSIIIPVHAKPILTYTCLASLHANTTAGSYEIVILDDASPEPAEKALSVVSGVRFVRNDNNVGFVGSCNRAAGLARGEILVFLNNDTVPTAGCRKPEALFGAMARRGTTVGTTIRTSPNTTTCAKWTIALAPVLQFRRSCSRSWADSISGSRPLITRMWILLSQCALRSAKFFISRAPSLLISKARPRAPTKRKA